MPQPARRARQAPYNRAVSKNYLNADLHCHSVVSDGTLTPEALAQRAGEVAGIGNVLEAVTPTMLNGLFGVVAGAVVLMGVTLLQRLRKPQPQKIPGH